MKKKQIRLNIDGLYLHERFSKLVLDALARMDAASARPQTKPKFTRAEREVLRTLYFVVFAS